MTPPQVGLEYVALGIVFGWLLGFLIGYIYAWDGVHHHQWEQMDTDEMLKHHAHYKCSTCGEFGVNLSIIQERHNGLS